MRKQTLAQIARAFAAVTRARGTMSFVVARRAPCYAVEYKAGRPCRLHLICSYEDHPAVGDRHFVGQKGSIEVCNGFSHDQKSLEGNGKNGGAHGEDVGQPNCLDMEWSVCFWGDLVCRNERNSKKNINI